MVATAKLIRQLGGTVEHAGFIISLPALGGEPKLTDVGVQCHAICEFEGEVSNVYELSGARPQMATQCLC